MRASGHHPSSRYSRLCPGSGPPSPQSRSGPTVRPLGPATIVILGADPLTTERVQRELRAPDFAVRAPQAPGGSLERMLSEPSDAAILDLGPDPEPRLRLLADLTERRPALPVITLAPPGRVQDRVRALEAGAADCLESSFVPAELRARMHARLRAAIRPATVLRHGAVELDLLTRTVCHRGATAHLTTTEFNLLVYFMTHPGQLLSPRQLLRAVWHYTHDPESNILQQYVRYLRRKLDQEGHPFPIRTVRRRGYWFGAPFTAGG